MTGEKINCLTETTFNLKIENATWSDSGFYTCSDLIHVPALDFTQMYAKFPVVKVEVFDGTYMWL